MRHSRKEKRRALELFRKFVNSNPPAMPADFSHKDYKRILNYARCAWRTAYNTAANDLCKLSRDV